MLRRLSWVKINPLVSGSSSLVYADALGGASSATVGAAIALRTVYNTVQAFITGGTSAAGLLSGLPAGVQSQYGGGGQAGSNFGDGFVVGLSGDGSQAVYSTYLGGSGNDAGTGIGVDGQGNIYVVGTTNSTAFPNATPVRKAGGGLDAFVAKINTAGTQYGYFTYLGGSSDEYGASIAVDQDGDAYLTGITESADFPTVTPLPGENQLVAGTEGFLTRLDPNGHVTFATYLGGTVANPTSNPPSAANVWGTGVFADDSGNVYVVGATAAANFPPAGVLTTPFQDVNLGSFNQGPGFNAFVLKVNLGTLKLVVNSTGDAPAQTNPDGSLTPSGIMGQTGTMVPLDNGTMVPEVTLRSAIMASNANVGQNTIDFAIPMDDSGFGLDSPGVWTIDPQTELPTITNAVIIDGTTQTGANANVFSLTDNAVLTVELNGSLTKPRADGTLPNGLTITAGNSTVKGLAINQFGQLAPAADIGNTFPSGIVDDVPVDGSLEPTVENQGNGISLIGAGGNNIQGDFIGTDATGTSSIPGDETFIGLRESNRLNGVFIQNSNNNLIGGVLPADRNVISGNDYNGIMILGGTGNQIQGNFIGTDRTGEVALGGGLWTSRNYQQTSADEPALSAGVYVGPGQGNVVGGTTAAARNIISGNGAPPVTFASSGTILASSITAVVVFASSGTVEGTYSGLDATGTNPLAAASTYAGIIIGGQSVTVQNNVVSDIGVADYPPAGEGGAIAVSASNSLIEGNLVGTNAFGNEGPGLGNSAGVTGIGLAQGANGNRLFNNTVDASTDGIDVAGNNNLLKGNTIRDNSSRGISLNSANNNQVIANTIENNALEGVYLFSANNNTIGGLLASAGNKIDNNGAGIHLDLSGTGNSFLSNLIYSNVNTASGRPLPGATLPIQLDPGGSVNPAMPLPIQTVVFAQDGPNRLINLPSLARAYNDVEINSAGKPATDALGQQIPNGLIDISGFYKDLPLTTFILQFFAVHLASASAAVTSPPRLLGSVTITTDITGYYDFSDSQPEGEPSKAITFPGTLAPDEFVYASATDMQGNTSEYSSPVGFFQKNLNDSSGPRGIAPPGAGPKHAVSGDPAYILGFTNPSTATNPVQVAVLSDTLDPSLDPSTVQLGPMGFGDVILTPPAGSTSYQTQVDLTATQGVLVNVSAGINTTTDTITWTFTSIDPNTGQVPTNPDLGFLPPDVTDPDGDIFATFSVLPRAGVATGTLIGAQAEAVFDNGTPIVTPLSYNTLDVTPPTSTVAPLPAITNFPSFVVNWSGQDDAGDSGIASYSVYVSENGGPFTPLVTDTTETSATFNGVFGNTYSFYSVATDNVGNVQPTPTSAQATTTLLQPSIQTVSGRGAGSGHRRWRARRLPTRS